MLFQLLTFIFLYGNINAANKLISLPLSVTSRLESKTFFRNQSHTFSFINFSDSLNNEADMSQQYELSLTQSASFISYSNEFSSIIGSNPQLKLIEKRHKTIEFAHEGGAFVPEKNEVWFTANQLPIQNTNISRINLATNHIDLIPIQPSIITPNGVNYFNGNVYVCSQGSKSMPAGIYAVNPTTHRSRVVVNSWFGYRLNSPNDVTFSTKIAAKTFMWFTDPQIAYLQGFANVPQYKSTVFRYDMLTSELRPVITDLVIPNGIAFNQDETVLYVSDTNLDNDINYVYAYDLNQDGLPINRRIFSVSSYGVPDGIKVDKKDRVWIAEGDGINVRDRQGTLLGVILGNNLSSSGIISNFGLVNDTVIILAQESVWRLDLPINVL